MRNELSAVQRGWVAYAGSLSSAVGEARSAGWSHAFAGGQEASGVDRLVSEPRGERASDLSALQHFSRHLLPMVKAPRRAGFDSPGGSQSPAAAPEEAHMGSQACRGSPSAAGAIA